MDYPESKNAPMIDVESYSKTTRMALSVSGAQCEGVETAQKQKGSLKDEFRQPGTRSESRP